MKITFYGHATFGFEINSKHLLIDPFITGNELASHIDINTLKADYILITHAHQDHTLDVEAIAKRTAATIVSNFEITSHYEGLGYKVHPMAHGGAWNFDFGMLKYVTAIHGSSFADGKYGGNPGGFVITANNKSVYIAGDTALTMDMKLIPMRHKIDLAILPIGDNFTMGIEDAILASNFVECDRILGCHYDTFGYIKIDKSKAKDAFKRANKELVLLDIGKQLEV